MNKREQAARVVAAIDSEPEEEEEALAVVKELGIDVSRFAERLRALVAERDDTDRKERYEAAAMARRRELADLRAIESAPKRTRTEHISQIRSYIGKLPPEQVSMHFMKFETASEDDLARLEALARYLTERDGRS